jgi:hypothetical protein
MKNTRAFLYVILAATIIVAVLAIVRRNMIISYPSQVSNVGVTSAIQNSNDLNSALQDVDKTNIDSMDTFLDQLNSDIKTF